MSLHSLIAILLLASTLAACSSGSGASDTDPGIQSASSSSARVVSQSDLQIATLLYSDTQRTPSGFYVEQVPTVSGYVTTSHIKSTDLGTGSTAHEICSDDWNQALSWSTSLHESDNAQLVGNDANSRYFEFDWLRPGTLQNYLRQRVFKCAYVDRSDVNLDNSTGAAGILNVRPLDASTLQTLSEYLWQFTPYNNFGNVVLKSSADTGGALSHSLIIATLQRGSSGSCDTINVLSWSHSASNSGTLQSSLSALWSFHAQQVSNVVSLCN